MADPAAFEVARQFGLDGVQVSLGTLAGDMHLRRAAMDDIDYGGAMQIEGAVPPGGKLIESYMANLELVRAMFTQKAPSKGTAAGNNCFGLSQVFRPVLPRSSSNSQARAKVQ